MIYSININNNESSCRQWDPLFVRYCLEREIAYS